MMITVTFVSILINIILNRLEFERRVRWVVQRLIYELAIVAVKADTLTARRLYEKWLLSEDKSSYQKRLLEGNPVYWVSWGGSTKVREIISFDKQLITMEAYRILRGRSEKENRVEKKGCW